MRRRLFVAALCVAAAQAVASDSCPSLSSSELEGFNANDLSAVWVLYDKALDDLNVSLFIAYQKQKIDAAEIDGLKAKMARCKIEKIRIESRIRNHGGTPPQRKD